MQLAHHNAYIAFSPLGDEHAPGLAIHLAVRKAPLAPLRQGLLRRAGRAGQQLVFVPQLEHHARLVFVELGGFVQAAFVQLIEGLQAQQGGGLRQMGVEQVADFLVGFVPGQRCGHAPGHQHQRQHRGQQPGLQRAWRAGGGSAAHAGSRAMR